MEKILLTCASVVAVDESTSSPVGQRLKLWLAPPPHDRRLRLVGRDLEESWLYQNALLRAGVKHEIGLHLSRPAGQIHVVVLSRGPGRDYDDRDRLVLRLLRRILTLPSAGLPFRPHA